MQIALKPDRMSLTLSPELQQEIHRRAEESHLSLNRAILQFLRTGIQAENQKNERLVGMFHNAGVTGFCGQ